MFSKFKIQEMMSKFDSLSVNNIADKKLQAKAKKLKSKRALKQGGFTLLELLVVVAILAAIAGTATIALQDTDARASAAAHVAMMDELNKGIRTFRVLNKNQLPNNFDSLIQVGAVPAVNAALSSPVTYGNLEIEDIGLVVLPSAVADYDGNDYTGILHDIGMSSLQYIVATNAYNPADGGDCGDTEDLINRRDNAVVPGNIFLTPAGNGCGVARVLEDGDTVAIWSGGSERITGQPAASGILEYDGTNLGNATGVAYMSVGVGPASTLFNANNLGGMTSVPVYRHVSKEKYNRFIALFDIGDFDGSGAIEGTDQVSFVGVVDGAGDTKEEELGEWDGQRNTI